MRTLAAAFALVYGSGLVLITLQALFLGGPDQSGAGGAIGIAVSVLAAFVYPVGMDPVWWLALALLALAMKQPGRAAHRCRPT